MMRGRASVGNRSGTIRGSSTCIGSRQGAFVFGLAYGALIRIQWKLWCPLPCFNLKAEKKNQVSVQYDTSISCCPFCPICAAIMFLLCFHLCDLKKHNSILFARHSSGPPYRCWYHVPSNVLTSVPYHLYSQISIVYMAQISPVWTCNCVNYSISTANGSFKQFAIH